MERRKQQSAETDSWISFFLDILCDILEGLGDLLDGIDVDFGGD